jgi:hypothetical protein
VAALDSVPRPPRIGAPTLPRPGVGALLRGWIETVVVVCLYCLGWAVGAILIPVAACFRWMFAAIAVGWEDAAMSWANEREDNG